MEFKDGFPIIYSDIDEDVNELQTGVNMIALVDLPATELEWHKFAKVEIEEFKEITDKDNRIITAPVMLADTEILRYSAEIGNYWTKFTPEAINRMMVKYFMQNKIHNINEMHSGYKIVDDIYMIESYQIGERTQSNLYPDIPNGSWVASFYVESEDYWNENIKTGKFKGISLEGGFLQSPEEVKYISIKSIVDSDLTDDEKYNKIKEML